MGKSTSCFKIITCGGDSANKDDLETIESKGSSDKRGWSFRKRSARHRVLSNTVITETPVPTFGNKEGSESANVNFGEPADNSAQEKISVVHCSDEKPQLITTVKAEVPDAVVTAESDNETGNEKEAGNEKETGNENETENEQETGNENETDAKIEESVVIAIQTAVRGFLAQRALLKLKNVVKLQAAVRGHIVRRHAVGTLRCVQAIVKMQALVRARHARLSLEGSRQKSDGKKQENAVNKSSGVKASTEKLLSNRFAHQLLESTPKAKRINVKCDPSKPDSAWKWLERWMSVSSVNAAESKKIESVTEHQEGKKKENSESLLGTNVESEIICESVDSKSSSVHESAVPSESEDNLITYEADKFEFQAYPSTTSSIVDNLEQPRIENTSTPYVKESSAETNSLQNQETQPDVDCQAEHKPLSEEPEQPKRSMKRLASEELEMESEAKKFVCGSKKTSNPSFITAQSKFEELSSAVNPGWMMNSSYQESGGESHKDISFETQSIIRTKEIGIAESPVHGSRIQLGGSECGTELSVTSTLDSPDRSDIGAIEHEHEAKASEEGICNPSNDEENLDLEAKDVPTVVKSSSSPTLLDQQEKLDVANGEFVSSVVSVDSPQIELKPEKKSYEFQREQQRPETSVQAHVLSPEASPRSHLTVAESQGTPVSQVSAKDRKNKPDKSGSDQKRGSLSATKKSPSNPNHDSGSRNSVEKLPKEQKNGKRRDSFGSTKPENCEQEPRDSSSNSSLPHFMQATESARAKANANNSPRSSPDVQDREIYIKKRHSLPGAANGRQGSPRIQRSMSQAQQGAKTNERKWQR
ncbi:protein IQ-DOMAIN 32 [Morus notabilis]|uniref:protein IQ-DOMAIN 32 n=1 Tax=Morus notabilis TaxID=981085 RepID=UPI000CED532C|nr:protein IQ-DOMAIN 32 [Morus notabilis]